MHCVSIETERSLGRSRHISLDRVTLDRIIQQRTLPTIERPARIRLSLSLATSVSKLVLQLPLQEMCNVRIATAARGLCDGAGDPGGTFGCAGKSTWVRQSEAPYLGLCTGAQNAAPSPPKSTNSATIYSANILLSALMPINALRIDMSIIWKMQSLSRHNPVRLGCGRHGTMGGSTVRAQN